MSDISDAEVVLLGPEERHGTKCFPAAQDVACCGLPLTLGHDKMLDADSFAGEVDKRRLDRYQDCRLVSSATLQLVVHR